ncbi:hypothetical protein, partial [Anaeromyxobacter sp. PSR-1]|uniref:hypothetical protein n=1 Tax=Anaeromyxobacter sp. PSR-1 TaxID=1300915 RepID=UPI001ED9C258
MRQRGDSTTHRSVSGRHGAPGRDPHHERLGELRVAEQLADHRRLALRREPRQQVRIAVRARQRLLVAEREVRQARVGLVARRPP